MNLNLSLRFKPKKNIINTIKGIEKNNYLKYYKQQNYYE